MTQRPAWYQAGWLPPLIALVVGIAVLFPGLGSFGLWEPPDTWPAVHKRRWSKDPSTGRKQKGPFDRPESELLLAEEARRKVDPPKSTTKDQRPTKTENADDLERPPRPPLTRALIAMGYQTFGVSEWAGRLPLALMGLLCLMLTYALLWRLYGRWVGLVGALILIGLPAFVLQSRQLTSDIVTMTCALLAVGGLGLWALPDRRYPLWALGLGVLGLVGGYFARGAVIGILVPLAAVLLAMVAGRRLFLAPAASAEDGEAARPAADLQTSYWVHVGVLGAGVLVLAIAAWAVLAGQTKAGYSAFLGETPLEVTQVLTAHGIKTPAYELPVFDVLIKQIGYAAYPWIALLPLALAALVWRRDQPELPVAPPPVPTFTDQEARRDRFGRLLLFSWLVVTLLVGTYWILRFGDLRFPALPAVAAAVAVLLRDLLREEPGSMRLGAALVALAVLAILTRDLGGFPETLVSTHINYQLQYPTEVSIKWMLRWVTVTFGVLCLALLICRGPRPPVTWPTDPLAWFTDSRIGLGRWLGFRLEKDAGDRSDRRGGLKAALVIAFLAITGGGLGWVLQRRPTPGPVIAGAILTPVLLPLIPYLLVSLLVDPLLYAIRSIWRIMRGRYLEPLELLFPPEEPNIVAAYWRRFFGLHPGLIVLLIMPALIIVLGYVARLVIRALILLVLLVFLHPLVTAYAVVREKKKLENWPVVPYAAVAMLVLMPLVFSGYLAHYVTPRLSRHFSYKAIFDTYNESRRSARPEPLALYRVKTRSPVFYTRGPLIEEHDLAQRFTRKAGASPMVQYLAEGWTDGKGRHFDRVYAIIPAAQLGPLDRDTHAHKPRVPYYVLDDRNRFYLLISNRLGKVKRDGRWVAEKDRNPLRKLVLDRPPRMKCGRDENAVCRPLQVTLAESKGATEPSLELIGARYPKIIYAGRKFEIVLYFRVLKRIHGKYKVFIHIDGQGNRILGDHDPVGDKYGTPLWLPGRWIVDRYEVPSSASSTVSTPSGFYTIYAGLFQGDRRMKVLSGHADKVDRVVVGRVRVGRPVFGCGG